MAARRKKASPRRRQPGPRRKPVAEKSVADARRELEGLWSRCELWELSPAVCDLAARLAPDKLLRTLDALHLATFLLARARIEGLELLTADRNRHPSKYAVVLVSEGARMLHEEDMSFESAETDQYGHRKLGGVGDKVSAQLKELSPRFNNGRRINVLNQRLGYLVRCGDPDALDSIVPMAFGNIAFDLVLQGTSGRLISIHNGCYDNMPIDVVTGHKKIVDVSKYYNVDRFRPRYETFLRQPLFIMTSDF